MAHRTGDTATGVRARELRAWPRPRARPSRRRRRPPPPVSKPPPRARPRSALSLRWRPPQGPWRSTSRSWSSTRPQTSNSKVGRTGTPQGWLGRAEGWRAAGGAEDNSAAPARGSAPSPTPRRLSFPGCCLAAASAGLPLAPARFIPSRPPALRCARRPGRGGLEPGPGAAAAAAILRSRGGASWVSGPARAAVRPGPRPWSPRRTACFGGAWAGGHPRACALGCGGEWALEVAQAASVARSRLSAARGGQGAARDPSGVRPPFGSCPGPGRAGSSRPSGSAEGVVSPLSARFRTRPSGVGRAGAAEKPWRCLARAARCCWHGPRRVRAAAMRQLRAEL